MSGEKKSLSGKSLRMKMAMGSAVIILFLLLLLLTNNYYAMNLSLIHILPQETLDCLYYRNAMRVLEL